MKNGTFAIWSGKEYEANRAGNTRYMLQSFDEKDMANGFQVHPFAIDNAKIPKYFKHVEQMEVDEFYSIKTYAQYKGYKFEVIKQMDKKVYILASKGKSEIWMELGLEPFDRGYGKWVDKDTIELIYEKTIHYKKGE